MNYLYISIFMAGASCGSAICLVVMAVVNGLFDRRDSQQGQDMCELPEATAVPEWNPDALLPSHYLEWVKHEEAEVHNAKSAKEKRTG